MNKGERQSVVKLARLLAETSGHAELHNAIYGPYGVASLACADEKQRREFLNSDEGKEISEIMKGAYKAAQGKSTGTVSLRLPKSLHLALKDEAESEGVSLNQLMLSKLSVNLKSAVA